MKTMRERVADLPTTNAPKTRWRWAACKCMQCHRWHKDLVPHYETVYRTERGDTYCRVECDRCLYGRVPLAVYDMYCNMRQALADQLGLTKG